MAFSGWASKESNLFGRWSQEALMGEQRSEAEKGEKPQLVCSWAPEGPVTGDPRRGEACSELSFPRRRGAGAFIGPVLPSASGLRLLPVSVSSGTSSLQCPGREDSSNQKRLSVQHSLLQLEGVKLTYTRMIRVQGITASMQWHSVPLTALPCGVFLEFLCWWGGGSKKVKMKKIYRGNPMTALIATLSPTKGQNVLFEIWSSLVLPGIFKTKVVKSRFQQEPIIASEIEECTRKTWYQDLEMFIYEFGRFFYDVFGLFCI